MEDLVFWTLFAGWQVAPAVLIWRARASGSLSLPGTFLAAACEAVGTAAAWYVARTDSSSTASLILLFSPLYLIAAVLVVWGADAAVRAVTRSRRP